MMTYNDIIAKYKIHFPEELRESAVDIFNKPYTIDMVQDDLSRLYIFGLKKLYVYEDEKEFKDIIEKCIKEGNKDAYFGLINYHISKKNFVKALECCKILEKEQYKLGNVYNLIAVIYTKMGESDTIDIIIKYFKKSIAYNDCDSSKENAGLLLMEHAKYEEALKYFTDVKIKHEYTYYSIGLCYYYLDETKKTLEYVDLAGDYGYVLRSLDLYKNNKHKEACDILMPVLKSNNINECSKNMVRELIYSLCADIKDYDTIIEIAEGDEEKNMSTTTKRCLAHAYMVKKNYEKTYHYLLTAHKEGDWQASDALLRIIRGKEEKE